MNQESAAKPPSGPNAPCPDADICQRCPAAADDDVCFPCERLAAELQAVKEAAERVQRDGRHGGRLEELLAITTKLGGGA